MWRLSGQKIQDTEKAWDQADGTPVFTAGGRWTTRGWTAWTQGFRFGSALLHYDATSDEEFLKIGLENTRQKMALHLTHTGVHDHGFNNVSTYGNLLRLWHENRLPDKLGGTSGDRLFYELALKVTGAVQAARWTELPGDLGYIPSFNGPHSLFANTARSLRALALSHVLGHALMGEKNRRINLLERLLRHAETTARYNVYYGQGRDSYDVRGRVAHESIFNLNDGSYHCPSSLQGYSPFTTWTRGLAWIMLGFAELLEFFDLLPESEFDHVTAGELCGRKVFIKRFLEVARATADFYLDNSPTDGVPYWDTGAPGLAGMGDYLSRSSDPFNEYEPVDSSAAAIAGQALLRLGGHLSAKGDPGQGGKYIAAGLTVASTLLEEPYLSTDADHHGLLLHSIYHRPGGWGHVPAGSPTPHGESSMWGDYHLRELALLIRRMAIKAPYYRFFPDQVLPEAKSD
ncbi:MAG: glycosyl hydrolase [Candidatus Glassbacteria bacterium]|nr:glycosyl hydrolase [Candidatus Glassbacteria bacterium]